MPSALADPQGGIVTGGAASISTSPNLTTITQSTDRAVIKWNSFDVNNAETVKFLQPSTSSITLNRVNDSKASNINGSIEANGNIMILNQNGIVFGQNAKIDVGGLIATTSQIDDNAFMAGNSVLNLTPGSNPSAAIINNGSITAKEAGLVGLVAPNVENNGVIEARLGKVTLAGAERVALDLAGDDLITVDVTDQVNGKVINKGAITADGGTIMLTAARAHNAVETSIVNTGKLQANSIGLKNGRIILSAGGITATTISAPSTPVASQPAATAPAPAVQNAGNIVARGDDIGEDGGDVDILGETIEMTNDSVIDVSAVGNAGEVHIGGDFKGEGIRPHAEVVSAAEGSVILANSLFNGNGGNVVLWADRLLYYRGRIEAESENGEGGLVEVSSKNILQYKGQVSTLSGIGANGMLLLDPTNIVISADPSQDVNGSSPFSPTADDVTSILNVTDLVAALAGGNVTVQTRSTGSQAGNITLDADLSWTSSRGLALIAQNDIILNQSITGSHTSSFLILTAGRDIVTNGAVSVGNSITMNVGRDINLNSTVKSTNGGILYIVPTASQSIGIGTGQTGTLSLNNTELNNMLNGFASIRYGSATNTGVINVGAYSHRDDLYLQTSTGTISINGAQILNGNNLVIQTDADLNLNSTVTSSGSSAIFWLYGTNAATSIGIGTGQGGTINLTDAEVARIQNGWTEVRFGSNTSTGAVNLGASNWVDSLTLRAGAADISVNGAINMAANTLVMETNADVAINANISGTGTINIRPGISTATMGVGTGQAGTLTLSDTELGFIQDGFLLRILGSNILNGALNIGAYTWTDAVRFQSKQGAIIINGDQNMGANALNIYGDGDVLLNAAIAGTGALTFAVTSPGVTFGVGDGQAGTANFTNAELDRIADGFSLITFGATNSGLVNVGQRSWADNVNFAAGTGININGNQVMGTNNLTLTTAGNIDITGSLSGSGILSFTTATTGVGYGVGTGQSGTMSLSDSELDNILNGWSEIDIGASTLTGAINVGARSWNDNLVLITSSGALNINGATNMNGNNLSLSTQSGLLSVNAPISGANNLDMLTNSDIAIGANITGSGNLNFRSYATSGTMGIGTGQAGTIVIDDGELNFIQDGWSNISFGSTAKSGAINIGSNSWKDNVSVLTTGLVSINGTQNFGANNFSISTNTNPVIAAPVIGRGIFSLSGISGNLTVALGTGQTGTLGLDNTELSYLLTGWKNMIFTSSGTSGINLGAYNWQYDVTFRSGAGPINVNGAQYTTGNMTFENNSNISVNANLAGTGILTIRPMAGSNTNIALNVGTSGLNLTLAELNLIQDGWSKIVIGRSDSTGALTAGAYTWKDNVQLITGSGYLQLAGSQAMGSNDLTLTTDSDVVFNGTLSGTGNLIIEGGLSSTSIGIGASQSGNILLSATELSRITNGWGSVTFGNATTTGNINLGTNNFGTNAVTFLTNGNITLNGVQTSTRTSGTSLIFSTLNGSFINNAGAGAVVPGTGSARYLIYSKGAATDTYNGLTFAHTVNGKSYFGYAPASVTETGNTVIYNAGAPKVIYLRIDNKNKVYGDTIPDFSYTYLGGLQGADQLTDVLTGVTYTAAASVLDNVGTVSLISGNYTTSLGYTVQAINGTMTVTKAPVLITPSNLTRAYGDANPAITTTYIGFKNGEDYQVIDTAASITNGATATTDVGVVAVTASGALDNNYLFNYANGSLTITKADLVVKADDATREYGDANPTSGVTYTGFKNGENISVLDSLASASTLATNATNAGTAIITASGGLDNNYNFVYIDGTLTITKATILATANNASREYGDANPALGINYTGFKNGEDASVLDTLATASTTANNTTNVGAAVITASGGADNNYNLTYANGTLTITKATVLATANNTTREYGDANLLGITYTGFKNGENSSVLDTLATASTTATNTTNVGTYVVTSSGGADNNYNITHSDGTLTITKAAVLVTANNATREYGDANPALGISYTGFKNGENSSVLDTLATASTTATNTTNAGTAVITASGGFDNNYNFVYTNGTLTITKATLLATGNNASREYGDANPTLGITYTGFKNGEDASVLDTLATASTTATNTTNVGAAAITASGGADNNYNLTYANGSLTITKANLLATANNVIREYGDANLLGITYTGFKNSETSSVLDTLATASTTATNTTNVGTAVITASGGSDNNYNLSYASGTLTITKANASVIADNKSKLEGDANPLLTYSVNNLKNGEDASVISGITLSTPASTTSMAGNYAITASGGMAMNYNLTYVNGVLRVNLPVSPQPINTPPLIPNGYQAVQASPSIQTYDIALLNTSSGANNMGETAQNMSAGNENGNLLNAYIPVEYDNGNFSFDGKAPLIYLAPELFWTPSKIRFSQSSKNIEILPSGDATDAFNYRHNYLLERLA